MSPFAAPFVYPSKLMPGSQAHDLYVSLCANALAPVLGSKGFKQNKDGSRFKCKDGDCSYQIAADFRQDRAADAGAMQVFVAVGFESVWRVLSKLDIFDQHDVFSAAGVRTSLQMLLPPGAAAAWSWLDDRSDAQAAHAELRRDVLDLALPYLEHHSAIDVALQHWCGETALLSDAYAAAATFLLWRELDRAMKVLEHLRQRIDDEYAHVPQQHQRELRRLKLFQAMLRG